MVLLVLTHALEVGGGVVTVCGRVCIVLGDIYINVYLTNCWRPKIVVVFAPPTVRSLEQVAVAKSFSRHLCLMI